MGLIKAIKGAAGGVLADQWKEYFYCDAMGDDVLAVKGKKRTSGRSSNTSAEENIISNGSVIAVNSGQAMLIVSQGKVVEMSTEPGEFVFDSSTEPSIFAGNLGDGIVDSFKTAVKRIGFGGDTAKDQRVYFINMAPVKANPFGTPTPIPFRVVDKNIGLDVDITLRCNGVYEFYIEKPWIFYEKICRNFAYEFKTEEIAKALKPELIDALQPALAVISEMGIRYSAIPGHNMEVKAALNNVLAERWNEQRGITLSNISFNSLTAPKEDEEMIKQLQKTAVMRNADMAAATLVGAQAEAMKAAASNENGAMMGFMGMGMAQQAGGVNANSLFQQAQQQQSQQQQMQQQQMQQAQQQQQAQQAATVVAGAVVEGAWDCSCGSKGNTGKFCMECGAKKPEEGWTCSCGAVNKGNFCPECGGKRPVGAPLYKCDKCGWEPEDPKNPPKFCPVCGDRFDDNDIVK